MKKMEYVVLFTILRTEDSVVYLPEKLVKGYYDKKNKTFITEDNEVLEHIINTNNKVGFAYRNDITEDVENNLLNYANSFDYEYSLQDFNGVIIPIITASDNDIDENNEKNTEEESSVHSFLCDRDILAFYLDHGFNDYAEIAYKANSFRYPEIEERLIKLGEPNIKELYKSLTSKIKGQNDKIKEILGFIWKNYYDKENYHNILVTGNKGVGKSTILKTIEENINIPCSRVTISHFTINITSGLRDLVNKADGDMEKAQNGILIIDDSEKLTTEDAKYLDRYNSFQHDILTLINNSVFNISDIENKPFYFDTKNLFIIMAGDYSKLKPYIDKHAGIITHDIEDTFKKINDTNLENNFFAKFSKVIKLNDLSKEDYLSILKSKEGILERTKALYKQNNVTINIDDSTLDFLADLASKMPYGVITINTLIERALSTITYEVAVNKNKKASVELSINNSGILEANMISPSKSKVRKRY